MQCILWSSPPGTAFSTMRETIIFLLCLLCLGQGLPTDPVFRSFQKQAGNPNVKIFSTYATAEPIRNDNPEKGTEEEVSAKFGKDEIHEENEMDKGVSPGNEEATETMKKSEMDQETPNLKHPDKAKESVTMVKEESQKVAKRDEENDELIKERVVAIGDKFVDEEIPDFSEVDEDSSHFQLRPNIPRAEISESIPLEKAASISVQDNVNLPPGVEFDGFPSNGEYEDDEELPFAQDFDRDEPQGLLPGTDVEPGMIPVAGFVFEGPNEVIAETAPSNEKSNEPMVMTPFEKETILEMPAPIAEVVPDPAVEPIAEMDKSFIVARDEIHPEVEINEDYIYEDEEPAEEEVGPLLQFPQKNSPVLGMEGLKNAEEKSSMRKGDEIMAEKSVPMETGEAMAEKSVPMETGEAMAEKSVPMENGEVMVEKSVPIEIGEVMAEKSVPMENHEVVVEKSVPIEIGEVMAEKNVPMENGEIMVEAEVPIEKAEMMENGNKEEKVEELTSVGDSSASTAKENLEMEQEMTMKKEEGGQTMTEGSLVITEVTTDKMGSEPGKGEDEKASTTTDSAVDPIDLALQEEKLLHDDTESLNETA